MAITAEDYTLLIFGILGTLVITVVGSLILRHLNIIGKTKDTSTITTINVGGLQEDFKEFKHIMETSRERTEGKLDGLIELIQKKDEAFRNEVRRLDERYFVAERQQDARHTLTEKQLIEINLRLKALEARNH